MKRKLKQQLCAFTAPGVHVPCSVQCVHHVTCTLRFMGLWIREAMEVRV